MTRVSEALDELGARVSELGWVTDVWIGGSLATGDHRVGVSDVDLVALVDGPLGADRVAAVRSLHAALDAGAARGLQLGCVYVDAELLPLVDERHPTWTHGRLVERTLSPLARAELARHGQALTGRGLRERVPADLLPPADGAAVRSAVRSELAGYWTWAVRRPWLWLDRDLQELAMVTMARARRALRDGELVSKTAVLDDLAGPSWLGRAIRARRTGEGGRSPGLLAPLSGVIARGDTVRTIRSARPG